MRTITPAWPWLGRPAPGFRSDCWERRAPWACPYSSAIEMSYVTVTWSVIIACPLLLAVMYGCVWIMDRQARAALAFAFEALGVALTAVVELGMMHASSPEEWGEWVRWIQVPIFIRTVALVTFIRF